ncbi:unnamed protein product, partial [Prorocentrum cordatum]
MVEVSAELHEHDQWSPKTMRYDYCSGEPLDEDLYHKGRDNELQAMEDYGVYVEVATCWWLRKAMNGARDASQMWGELVRTITDDGHWECLAATPNAFHLPASPSVPAVDEDSVAICHGDDLLAEGYDEQLDELDELLKRQFE